MKSKIFLIILLLGVSLKLTAQYGIYYNKELSVELEINPIGDFFMQIMKPEAFIHHDKKMIDDLLTRDKELYSTSGKSDVILVPIEGTLISGQLSIEEDKIILKDRKSHQLITTFTLIDSMTIKLNYSTIKTFTAAEEPIYFYKTVSYFTSDSDEIFPPKVSWKYSNFDETTDDSGLSNNWYFYNRDEHLIKVIPDSVLTHPLSGKKINPAARCGRSVER